MPRHPLSGPLLIAVALSFGALAVPTARADDPASHSQPQAAAAAPDLSAEKPFLDENQAAMDQMMSDMDVKPTGDVDADFAAMMIPHHQGAINMAIAQLRYGKNEQLRRIAQEIIVEQQQEIAAMQLALGQKPISGSSPTQSVAQDAANQGAAATPQAASAHDHSAASHDAMSHDAMSHDAMSHDAMSHGAMSHDAMSQMSPMTKK